MNARSSLIAFGAAVLAFALVFGPTARALDAFEYQVYDAGINKIGEYSIETHFNSNLNGKTDPEYPGKLNENHLNHLKFEFARGMTSNWELGAYLQTALGEDGVARYAGAKLRSKFVRPRAANDSLQLGVNFEIADVPPEFERDRWGAEARPIVGYSLDRWTLTFNPILDVDLTEGSDATPSFLPALKLVFDTRAGFGAGLEYYGDFGGVFDLARFDQAEQYAFAAFDLLDGPIELNVALGSGLTSNSNPCVVKTIVGFGF